MCDQRTTGEQREHNRETDKRAEHAQDEAGRSGRAHSELAERTGETQVEHGGRRQAGEADERTEPVQDGTSREGGEVEDVDGSDGGERSGHKGRAGHKQGNCDQTLPRTEGVGRETHKPLSGP